jgi:hypothetical protein
MPFLQGTAELPAAIINSTGTFLRFRRTQRAFLPSVDVDVSIHMPDGRKIHGIFTSTAAFPYVRGPEVRRWIQGWLQPGETRAVTVRAARDGIELAFATPAPTLSEKLKRQARRKVIRFAGDTRRTRKTYERWERDPLLRRTVIDVWGSACQVRRCRAMAPAGYLSGRLSDVHHLRSVSGGGDDSPLNLCVLCVMHHALMHRGPTVSVTESSLTGATITVNGLTLVVRRDVRGLMAALGA